MITLTLDAQSVAQIRFAASPAQELLQWLLRTVSDEAHPTFGRPEAAARSALVHPQARFLTEVAQGITAAHYSPDFLTPSPSLAPGSSAIADQIERVAATPETVAAAQLELLYSQSPCPPPRLVCEAIAGGTVASQAAEGMRTFWAASLGEVWGNIQRVVNSDIARRSTLLSRVGTAGMLASLHSDVSWASSEIRIATSSHHEQHSLRSADVVLVPLALGDSRIWTQACSKTDVWLGYPIPADASTTDRAVSAVLLGERRAAIVDLLTVRRTTRELASLLRASPADVSYHLQLLLRAGVVNRERSGRWVYYQLSA